MFPTYEAINDLSGIVGRAMKKTACRRTFGCTPRWSAVEWERETQFSYTFCEKGSTPGVRTSAWNMMPRGMEYMFATTASVF